MAQIDLIIDRSDRNIDLCEMKYSDSEYELKRDYVDWMLRRRDLFREATHTTKSLRLMLITASGIKQGKHLSSIQGFYENSCGSNEKVKSSTMN